jgi:hypothetical protein
MRLNLFCFRGIRHKSSFLAPSSAVEFLKLFWLSTRSPAIGFRRLK